MRGGDAGENRWGRHPPHGYLRKTTPTRLTSRTTRTYSVTSSARRSVVAAGGNCCSRGASITGWFGLLHRFAAGCWQLAWHSGSWLLAHLAAHQAVTPLQNRMLLSAVCALTSPENSAIQSSFLDIVQILPQYRQLRQQLLFLGGRHHTRLLFHAETVEPLHAGAPVGIGAASVVPGHEIAPGLCVVTARRIPHALTLRECRDGGHPEYTNQLLHSRYNLSAL